MSEENKVYTFASGCSYSASEAWETLHVNLYWLKLTDVATVHIGGEKITYCTDRCIYNIKCVSNNNKSILFWYRDILHVFTEDSEYRNME